jgi:hypothetical protein
LEQKDSDVVFVLMGRRRRGYVKVGFGGMGGGTEEEENGIDVMGNGM